MVHRVSGGAGAFSVLLVFRVSESSVKAGKRRRLSEATEHESHDAVPREKKM